MEKIAGAQIRTSDFAKLCGTTRRTLLHYDAIGLFSPAGREENGYRFYREDQYDVFLVITALKELGMPLEEIKAYLDTRNPQALQELLALQEAKIASELSSLRQIQKMIVTKKSLLSLGAAVPRNVVLFEQMPEEILILSQPIHSREPTITAPALYHHLSLCHKMRLNIGYPFGAMIAEESLKKGEFDVYAYYFTKTDKVLENVNWVKKPAGEYATFYLQGDYLQAESAFSALLEKVAESGREVCGSAYKEGIIDEIAQQDRAKYLTKISIPVKRQ